MGASSYIEDSRQSKRVSKGLVVAVVALPLLLLNVIAYFLGLYSNTACDVGSTCGPSFNPAVLLGTFAVTFAYLAIAYAGSTRASLAFTGATKADGTYSEARSLLENVSIAAGIPTPTLYIVQDPAPEHPPPLQPTKFEPFAAVAISVTAMPALKRVSHI